MTRSGPPRTEYRWLLPSALLAVPGPDGARPRMRRTVRDWMVDGLCFVFAAVFGFATAVPAVRASHLPDLVLFGDQIVGALACCALWLRRRWPVGVAAVVVPLGAVSAFVPGAVMVAVFTVAVHRPFRTLVSVCGAALATMVVYPALRPDPDLPYAGAVVVGALVYLTPVGWGMFVRARRRLVLSLREQARRAEAEAELRADQAQRLAREAIAREMHDVLAHRLSLLSVHAGALEYRPDAAPGEIAEAAGVVRDSAHRALQELREVIGVLRAPVGTVTDDADPDEAARPRPGLERLPLLVEESRRAGMRVTLADHARGAGEPSPPEAVGRTAYRVVQEGLTNARKHAPTAEVTVTVDGAPGVELTVEVRNPLPEPADSAGIPGAGRGLAGLAERVMSAGGRLDHGDTDRESVRGDGTVGGVFRLYAWLPWQT